MKISEILLKKKTLSFEVFPPKKGQNDLDKLYQTIDQLRKLNPDFISVTFGAFGNDRQNTNAVAKYIKDANIESLAHITGCSSSFADIDNFCQELEKNHLENILVLRGDKPINEKDCMKDFFHASDLMAYIKNHHDNFCMAGACYPEGHNESTGLLDDLEYIKKKEINGASFFISQLFFDNDYFYRLVKEARKMQITAPIIAGIMPVINARQIQKMIKMCGVTVPLSLRNLLERYYDDPQVMEEIGINFASNQIIDLLSNDIDGIHIYTMNNARLAEKIVSRVQHIINREIKND